MANIINQYGQVKLGVRYVSAPLTSTLWGNIYAVYNADAVGSSSLNTSLFAAYNGESNTNDSKGTNNGTAMGGLTYAAGKIGNAFVGNGTTSYVSLPTSSFNNLTGDFSVSCWFKTNTVSGNQMIFSNFAYNGGARKGFYLYLVGSTIEVWLANQPSYSQQIATPSVISINTWYNIVLVRESGVVKIYLNGTLLVTDTNAISLSYVTTTPSIGAYTNGATLTSYFNGNIDALNVWSKALTQSEITELYNSGNGAQYITDNFYKPTTNDALLVKNGTPQGGLTYGVGKVGTAFVGNGTTGYVSLPYNGVPLVKLCIPELGSVLGQYGTYVYPPANSPTVYSVQDFLGVDYSISMWVYLPDVTSGQYLMSTLDRGSTGYQYGWGMVVGSGSIGQYEYYGNGSYNNVNTPITANAWHHVVITRKGPLKNGTNNGTIKIYLNGVLANTTSPSNNTSIRLYSLPAWSSVGVGAWGDSFGSANKSGYVKNGTKIDAITIWDKELSVTEVTELYNSGNGKQYPN